MHQNFCFPRLLGMLLLAAASLAGTAAPLPDPVAPAVVGRPLDQIRPVRKLHRKHAAATSKRHRLLASQHSPAHARHGKRVELATASARAAAPAPSPPPRSSPSPAPVAIQQEPPAQHVVTDTRTMGNSPAVLHFSSRDQALVRSYYAAHPTAPQPPQWNIGEPIPPKSALSGVPDDLRAALPPLPTGHQYVEVDGDVVLVAVQSRVVMDGISRGAR